MSDLDDSSQSCENGPKLKKLNTSYRTFDEKEIPLLGPTAKGENAMHRFEFTIIILIIFLNFSVRRHWALSIISFNTPICIKTIIFA
ncbi:MAG: hypothetical protein A6F71_09985 [Cycloclasticus sp. symbiont of Poecilosclerida sp. M]|nr:MAG: hypothetical protein A6F71_09985 [Cycloclasticus sp. symbiont of Poecilosclerida sp. M]